MIFERGMYRVHAQSNDSPDSITVAAPLGEDGRLVTDAPRPWLFKAVWDGADLYGEVRPEMFLHKSKRFYVLHWGDEDGSESITDLFTVPPGVGRQPQLWEAKDVSSPSWLFTIKSVQKLL